MALSIKDHEADRLARALAKATGESLTDAVRNALKERLRRVQPRTGARNLGSDLTRIALRCAALPDLDPRSAEDIVGFDQDGLPR